MQQDSFQKAKCCHDSEKKLEETHFGGEDLGAERVGKWSVSIGPILNDLVRFCAMLGAGLLTSPVEDPRTARKRIACNEGYMEFCTLREAERQSER